ncbi:MAG: serine dehydratase [Rhodobacterales bacterium]|nr:MAG: serine dehydratase [Rhodobacterales bacterium]
MHITTPLLTSAALSATARTTVALKMEALQPSGSFKIRGIGALCAHHAARGRTRFISSSGGNAGLAAAYAGRMLGLPVTVFVPETTTPRAADLIRQQGAEVIVHGASWQEANASAQDALDTDAAFIHPFDDPIMWRGHASMIDEAVAQGDPFDAVVLSVGGGGLLCGVAEGLARNGLADVPILAVETEGAASLGAAVAAGELVELDAIRSVATSLGARQVARAAFELTRTRPVTPVTVTDAQAVSACLRFLDDARVLVEPACGAALSLAYDRPDLLAPYARVLMIVCGGATATLAQLQTWAREVGAA